MFSKILVATDLSEASSHVIGCLGGLRALGAKEIILAHALGIRHLDYLKYEWIKSAEPILFAQKNVLEKLGYKVKIEIGDSDPAWEVNKIADKEKASLIAIGTHGKSMLSHMLLGGVATGIMQTVRKPLLIIRLQMTEAGNVTKCKVVCHDFKKEILYATDFSDTAQEAFTYVEKIVEGGCRKVTLMHVQDKTRIDRHLKNRLKEFNQIDKERLEMLKSRLIKKGAKRVEVLLSYGLPINEILKASKKGGYSLIVMGSQGRGYAKELFLGSVSHNVVRHASLPVLLVPAIR